MNSSAYAGRFNLFFFSSRRRHTRSKRDWSSDVCSSDLALLAPGAVRAGYIERSLGNKKRKELRRQRKRSEERRVGKECRSGWAPDHEKKKELKRGVDSEITNDESIMI